MRFYREFILVNFYICTKSKSFCNDKSGLICRYQKTKPASLLSVNIVTSAGCAVLSTFYITYYKHILYLTQSWVDEVILK